MANDISLPSPNINPGYIQPGPMAPNALDNFLASYLGAQQQKSSESVEARKFELAQSQFDLEKGKMDAMLAQQAHEHDMEQQRGKTVQAILKIFGPTMESQAQATGTLPPALQGMMGDPSAKPNPFQSSPQAAPMAPQGGIGAPSPVSAQPQAIPAAPQKTMADLVNEMSPEAAAGFAEKDLPVLLAAQKQAKGEDQGQVVQYGKGVTTYVPGKGFWDPEKKAFVPSIERGRNADEEADRALDRELRRQQIQTQITYRQAIQSQGLTRNFVTRTKDLQGRGAIINQAIQTIGDAQNNPDPNARKVLTSSAIANFVQAADQKAQLRYQLLNYFKNNIDPSVGGKWEVLRTRMLQGTLPQYVTQGMLSHLQNLLAMSRSEYERQRVGEVKRHPDLVNWLPEADEFFTADHPNGSTTSSDELPPPP